MSRKFRRVCLILFLLFVFLFIILLVYQKDRVLNTLNNLLPAPIAGTIQFFAELNVSPKKINNDYNVKFLPESQYAFLNFNKYKLPFVAKDNIGYLKILKKKPFVFDIYKDYLIVMPANGTFFNQQIDQMILGKKFNMINSNLNTNNALDIFIDNDDIYVSYEKKIKNCSFLYLAKSKINLKKLNFENIFVSNECVSKIQSGRIQKTIIDNEKYILLATAADIISGRKNLASDSKPQNEKSIYGKIISINVKDFSHSIFSKGHRNILGLYSKGDVIISTENGPRGGDEINRIYKDKNYGWPISSDGNMYVDGYNDGDEYSLSQRNYKDHEDMGFENPIFSFIPSIGITEIVELEDEFIKTWKNNFLVGSLNSKHLYRIKFDKEFKKINYYEKIFVGERIRDLKYHSRNSQVIMALEDSGSLGILKKKINQN